MRISFTPPDLHYIPTDINRSARQKNYNIMISCLSTHQECIVSFLQAHTVSLLVFQEFSPEDSGRNRAKIKKEQNSAMPTAPARAHVNRTALEERMRSEDSFLLDQWLQ
jgi:hypothetical protein